MTTTEIAQKLIKIASEKLCSGQIYDSSENYFMNPLTGSIDTEDNWIEENGKKVLNELIEVKFDWNAESWISEENNPEIFKALELLNNFTAI